jgi:hypothetical protein
MPIKIKLFLLQREKLNFMTTFESLITEVRACPSVVSGGQVKTSANSEAPLEEYTKPWINPPECGGLTSRII